MAGVVELFYKKGVLAPGITLGVDVVVCMDGEEQGSLDGLLQIMTPVEIFKISVKAGII
jgi:hypothetical protein